MYTYDKKHEYIVKAYASTDTKTHFQNTRIKTCQIAFRGLVGAWVYIKEQFRKKRRLRKHM